MPDADNQSGSSGDDGGLSAARNDANQNFGSSPVGTGVQACPKTSWIEIKLVDQDSNPVPGEAYRVQVPDGSTVEGDLDDSGFARVDGIDPGTCQVTFPNLDGHSWHPQ